MHNMQQFNALSNLPSVVSTIPLDPEADAQAPNTIHNSVKSTTCDAPVALDALPFEGNGALNPGTITDGLIPAAVPFPVVLSGRRVAWVDPEDYGRVSRFRWSAAWSHYYWTARASVSGRTVSLHRFVMNAPRGLQVDHINGHGLDCRKSQLRLATHQQNNCNTLRLGKKSAYKCVRPIGRGWQARIKLQGKQRNLGTYDTAEQAAKAYDAAARRHFGEFARCNFPDDGSPCLARTGDLQIRNLTLYPSELRGHAPNMAEWIK